MHYSLSFSSCPSHSYFLFFSPPNCVNWYVCMFVCTYVRISACMHACLRDLMRFSDGSSSNKMAAIMRIVMMTDTPGFNVVD